MLFSNAMEFNAPDTVYHQAAQRILGSVAQILPEEEVAPTALADDGADDMSDDGRARKRAGGAGKGRGGSKGPRPKSRAKFDDGLQPPPLLGNPEPPPLLGNPEPPPLLGDPEPTSATAAAGPTAGAGDVAGSDESAGDGEDEYRMNDSSVDEAGDDAAAGGDTAEGMTEPAPAGV
jgi:hypothetical protein